MTQSHPPKPLTWETLDWEILDRLRQGFLAPQRSGRAYWQSEADLAHYDFTYGERIGWKWDGLLAVLAGRGWSLPAGPVLDWGCGSGIAGRRVLGRFGTAVRPRLLLHDRSPKAMEFARKAAETEFPGLEVAPHLAGAAAGSDTGEIGTLVVSHVLNELPNADRRELLRTARRATAVLWVEPGTHADSHGLIGVREELRREFGIVAPCPQAERCGLTKDPSTPHWCHFFARPPAGIYADSGWVRFAQRAGIDLRSLPYSCLVLDRRRNFDAAVLPTDAERLLGLPRFYKGYARVFSCSRDGVRDVTIQERGNDALFDALREGEPADVFRWVRDGEKIRGTQPATSATVEPVP